MPARASRPIALHQATAAWQPMTPALSRADAEDEVKKKKQDHRLEQLNNHDWISINFSSIYV